MGSFYISPVNEVDKKNSDGVCLVDAVDGAGSGWRSLRPGFAVILLVAMATAYALLL